MNKFLSAILLVFLFACGDISNNNAISLLSESDFSTTINGQRAKLFTLKNKNGMTIQLTNYGARLVSLWVPANGQDFKDVVLGFDSAEKYCETTNNYSGPVVQVLKLNENSTSKLDLKTKIWDYDTVIADEGASLLKMKYIDTGAEGNDNVSINIIYKLTDNNELVIDMNVDSDKRIISNSSYQAYFNLHGTTAQSTNSHILQIHADYFISTVNDTIGYGLKESCDGTPLDFRTPMAIGEKIYDNNDQFNQTKGYDHTWILNHDNNKIATRIYEYSSGIEMKIETNQPCIRFYSGNNLDGSRLGKGGKPHLYRTGIILEPQNYPFADNYDQYTPNLLHQTLKKQYRQKTTYTFECTETLCP